jgi:hypothetical protein
MKPAFSTVQKCKPKKTVAPTEALEVSGPIDLDGTEIEAYFWVRVTQKETKAEAIGLGEMDKEDVTAEVDRVKNGVLGVLDALPAGSRVPKTAPNQIRAVTAMWSATIPVTSGRFVGTKPVRVQAWALVNSSNPDRTFHVYWEEQDVKLTTAAKPRP